jgi:Fe2+ or Zn2+ uptake regulation protein
VRATKQRIAVLEKLRASGHHPTAAELHRQLLEDQPNMSLKTVYEALDTLVGASLAGCVAGAGGGPARYEPNASPHYHAQCRVCGSLSDVRASADGHIRGGSALPEGFEVEEIQVILRGVCQRCRDAV